MKPSEGVLVVRELAAYFPNQKFDDFTIDVWARALTPYDYQDGLEAVRTIATRPLVAGQSFLLELRDITSEIGRMRQQRVADRKHQVEPPREVADDPAAYQRWLADTYRAMEARDWNPPKAIEYPARPVGTLIGRIAAKRSA